MSDITVRPENAVAAPDSMMNFIALALENPAIDATKLKALLDMQREVVADQARVSFNAALHQAQAEMPRVKKNGTVELGGGKGYAFATWSDMDTALRPILDRHGFTLSFNMASKDGGGAVVTGILTHVAGHSKEVSLPLALDSGPGRNNLQAMGSTLSYGKRYCAEMLFNIVREGADDDGKLGGTVFINPAEVAEIDRLLTETKADRVGFLRFMAVDDLDTIQKKDFAAAINALMKKKAKGAGA